ncbi:MAG TPA: substrate-binding domain-containing protein [Thermodesulfobacteriota bacterium]|nr:substrate-binding domain-containing protein [Thermodesulfobacteriota bacterium]
MVIGIAKRTRTALIILVALAFVVTTLGSAQAGTFQIPAKGNKKIKIGVLDLIAGIEVSALSCNWYRKHAKERGWDLQVFDMAFNYANAQSIMENMITAGYDGIIVNWVDFKYYDQQVLKAYNKGIPVQGIACGNNVPGVISQGIAPDMAMGALSSMYLVTKLHEGDKVLVFIDPQVGNCVFRFNTAKVTFDMYRIKIAQEMHYPGKGDPSQVCYEAVRNALLADTKKEIKGVWTHWEGYGIPAARAAMDMGRKDIVVVTSDGSPNTYKELRELPTLHATSDTIWDAPNWTSHLFKNFDKIFAGQPFVDNEVWFSVPNLVTKENLPPPGYYYSPCGYKGRPADFQVK